ncbi:MAG: type II CAAX endopeptidase family protein [Pseudomonadota bacterium]
MPFLSADSLSLVDILFIAIIILGLPIESLLNLKKGRAELASGTPGARIKLYSQTILLLWGLAIPTVILWAASGRAWDALGFQLVGGPMAISGWLLAALIAGFFLVQYSSVTKSAAAREKFRDDFAKNTLMSNFMPHTDAERRIFNVMGISAGIAEEIVFRGYLIWAFSLYLPLWAAALASLLVFTLLHIYQGASQLPLIFLSGAAVTLVFLLSGSLWPAIALHIFVDVINNNMVWKARGETVQPLQAAPSV